MLASFCTLIDGGSFAAVRPATIVAARFTENVMKLRESILFAVEPANKGKSALAAEHEIFVAFPDRHYDVLSQ